MTNIEHPIDSEQAIIEARRMILRKPCLRAYYADVYRDFASSLQNCAPGGKSVEIGSGGGFLKEFIPEVITSDFTANPFSDMSFDALNMPFEPSSLRAVLMMNVFHHISNSEKFLSEVERCLKPGGKLILFDQHVGILSQWIYQYLHSEPYDKDTTLWSFDSSGPMSGANGAMSWIVFKRDRTKLSMRFPKLKLNRYDPVMPLTYWLVGGLKRWSLVPRWGYPLIRKLDSTLVRIIPDLGSFAFIELQKQD